MADENVSTSLTPKEVVPNNIGKMVLEPFNHAIAAGLRQALKDGIQTHEVVELLMNQLTSIIALVQPPGAREQLIRDVVGSIHSMTKHYVQVHNTTPGGILLPRAAE